MTPIIKSILDLDLYKLTVQQIFFFFFSLIEGEYEFKCRNPHHVKLLDNVPEDQLREQIFVHLPKLRLEEKEETFLEGLGLFKAAYLTFLRNFRFNPAKEITLIPDRENNTYIIRAKGALTSAMLYETFILSIVNELYTLNTLDGEGQSQAIQEGERRLNEKIALMKTYNAKVRKASFVRRLLKLIEFGTRRRFSAAWQEYVLLRLMAELSSNLVGTSNVFLAMKYGLKPIGTFGHEGPMAMQGMVRVQDSQKEWLKLWLEFYEGKLGIALSDTLGDAKFHKDFTRGLAVGYEGTRHDSGDPYNYAYEKIEMYENMQIDPQTKGITFSDGLDFALAIDLDDTFGADIQTGFGIGTNLTNDLGRPVPQNVMKIVWCNGQDVAKLSANPAKASCKNPVYLDYIRMAVEKY